MFSTRLLLIAVVVAVLGACSKKEPPMQTVGNLPATVPAPASQLAPAATPAATPATAPTVTFTGKVVAMGGKFLGVDAFCTDFVKGQSPKTWNVGSAPFTGTVADAARLLTQTPSGVSDRRLESLRPQVQAKFETIGRGDFKVATMRPNDTICSMTFTNLGASSSSVFHNIRVPRGDIKVKYLTLPYDDTYSMVAFVPPKDPKEGPAAWNGCDNDSYVLVKTVDIGKLPLEPAPKTPPRASGPVAVPGTTGGGIWDYLPSMPKKWPWE